MATFLVTGVATEETEFGWMLNIEADDPESAGDIALRRFKGDNPTVLRAEVTQVSQTR